MADRICSVDSCPGKHIARGLCNRHYLLWRRHGDPLAVGTVGRPRVEPDALGYSAVHRRLSVDRGRASDRACTSCGGQAEEWAHRHSDPEAECRTDEKGRTYSSRLEDYDPLCRKCHERYDFPEVLANGHRRSA